MRIHAQPRGATLLEVAVAVAIFGLMIALTFVIVHSTTISFQEKVQTAGLQVKGERALKRMSEEISDGTLLKVNLDVKANGFTFKNAQIRFRVPIALGSNRVGLPVNKDVMPPNATYHNTLDPNGTDFTLLAKFGWRDNYRTVSNNNPLYKPNPPPIVPLQGPELETDTSALPPEVRSNLVGGKTPDGQMGFRFVMDPLSQIGKDGIFDEAVEGIDLDSDGLLENRYALGRIEGFYSIFPSELVGTKVMSRQNADEIIVQESIQMLAVSNILQPIVADLPDDSDPAKLKTNRIFTQSATSLDIYLWLVHIGEDRRPRVAQCITSVFLRNSDGQ